MEFVYAFLIAMLASMAALPILVYVGNRFAFVDEPSPRKVHSTPIPRIGGPAIALGSMLAICIVGAEFLNREVVALLLAGLVVLIMGLLDDRRELGYRPKFLAQFISAALVVYVGDISLHTLTLPYEIQIPGWLSAPLSLLVVVALMNAVALSDGLDGLAGGIVFLCCLALCVLGYVSLNVEAALLAIAVAGAIFGFLRFNTHPASVFMGDSGSQFIGLMSAVLAIQVTQSADLRISAALPLFLLAIPIIDTLQVSIYRIRQGRSPFRADKNHLHHRLLGIGLKHHQAVLVIYLIQCVFFLLAYNLRYESDLLVAVVFAASASLLLISLNLAENLPTIGRQSSGRVALFDGQWRQRVSVDARKVVAVLLAAYGFVLVAQAWIGGGDAETYDASALWQVRLLAYSLFGLLLVALIARRWAMSEIVITAVGYVTAAVLAFLASSATWTTGPLETAENLFVALLAVVCMLALGLSNRNGVQLTTLDTLILFGAVAVPSLPGLLQDQSGVGMLVMRLVIFFYAAEVIAAFGVRYRAVPLAAALALVILHLQFLASY